MKPSGPNRPFLSRSQTILLIAGLGLAIAMAPGLVVPRFGTSGYLMLIALSAAALAVLAVPSRRR